MASSQKEPALWLKIVRELLPRRFPKWNKRSYLFSFTLGGGYAKTNDLKKVLIHGFLANRRQILRTLVGTSRTYSHVEFCGPHHISLNTKNQFPVYEKLFKHWLLDTKSLGNFLLLFLTKKVTGKKDAESFTGVKGGDDVDKDAVEDLGIEDRRIPFKASWWSRYLRRLPLRQPFEHTLP